MITKSIAPNFGTDSFRSLSNFFITREAFGQRIGRNFVFVIVVLDSFFYERFGSFRGTGRLFAIFPLASTRLFPAFLRHLARCLGFSVFWRCGFIDGACHDDGTKVQRRNDASNEN